MNEDAMQFLVDSANGIYAWYRLAKNYPLFDENGNRWYLEKEFNPDNEEWAENVEWFSDRIFVSNQDTGYLWRIEQSEHGDIWAINPNAIWNEENQEYELERAK
jgi:hypothetical protein